MTDPRPSRQPESRESELVDLIRGIDVRAPDSLHEAVDAMIAQRTSRAGRGFGRTRGERRAQRSRPRLDRPGRAYGLRPRLAALGAIAAAVTALAIAIGTNGGSTTLSVHDASAPTLRAATSSAPRDSASNRAELAASVDGVAFPYWSKHFGWRATGMRSDRVDARPVTTVFYEGSRGRRVGYAIVGGNAPSQLSGGIVARRDGVPYRLLTVNGVAVVAWMRQGHLCVVSGRGVDGATLLRLASWDERRAQTS
jgi:hypothetical protein